MKNNKNFKTAQALTEYLILVALLGIGSMAVVQILGTNVRARLADVSDAIRGGSKETKRAGTKGQESDTKQRDMGDFTDAITDTSQE